MAMIEAAAGRTSAARATATSARRYGSGIEMRHCSRLAEAIAEGIDGDSRGFRQLALTAVLAAGRGDYLDGIVFAYRLHPPLLAVAEDDPEAQVLLSKALALARDHTLARRSGIPVRTEDLDDPLAALTRREQEVLDLLSQGMTNADIARSLFITTSTAKVHVRNILGKLGARNRLEAVIRAQELLADDAS
jgi:ATP/maltotriose-dependent transcriptional regulator MalT